MVSRVVPAGCDIPSMGKYLEPLEGILQKFGKDGALFHRQKICRAFSLRLLIGELTLLIDATGLIKTACAFSLTGGVTTSLTGQAGSAASRALPLRSC